MDNTEVIVMAAGFSKRMGSAKAILKWSEQNTFVEHICNEYEKWGVENIVVVVNTEVYKLVSKLLFSPKVKVVVNDMKYNSKFYTLNIGLRNLNSMGRVFIHNVDNPFVEPSVLDILIADNADYVWPKFKNKGGHPFVLSSRVVRAIINSDDFDVHLKQFFMSFKSNYVNVDSDKILVNINSPEDYLRVIGSEL